MTFESMVDEVKKTQRRRTLRRADRELFLAVRHYKTVPYPKLVIRVPIELIARAGLQQAERLDIMFDKADCTGLICERDGGIKPSMGGGSAVCAYMYARFIPTFTPDFGENGYVPERVEVRKEGILFAFPRHLYSTGRNGVES